MVDNTNWNEQGTLMLNFYLFVNRYTTFKSSLNSCGKIYSSERCREERECIKYLSPPQNMINWMESVEFAHHTKDKSDHDLGCFLVHFGCNFPCATYFEGSEIEQLLSFHFLVSLNANQKGLESLKCAIKAFYCFDFDLLPDTICDYEFGKIQGVSSRRVPSPIISFSIAGVIVVD